MEALAKECGVSAEFFEDQRAREFPHWRLRWAVEGALGFRPIWSNGAAVEMRRRCSEITGHDPRLITLTGLKTLCRRFGAEIPAVRQREAIYNVLEEKLALLQSGKEVQHSKHNI